MGREKVYAFLRSRDRSLSFLLFDVRAAMDFSAVCKGTQMVERNCEGATEVQTSS